MRDQSFVLSILQLPLTVLIVLDSRMGPYLALGGS